MPKKTLLKEAFTLNDVYSQGIYLPMYTCLYINMKGHERKCFILYSLSVVWTGQPTDMS